jgi:iron complex transport system substrate-binding protein
MRAFACALAISLALAGAGSAAGIAPPRLRVASLNLCTDELLLLLGDPREIASVTHLSQSEAETPLWRVARRYRVNDGSLVSVVPLRPNLVLTMGGGARDRSRIAERLHIRVLNLAYPQSLADIEQSIVDVAAALGRPQAAKPYLASIERLKQSRPVRQIDTIWLGGGGRSVAATGLPAQWMALAGLRQRRLTGDRVSLEQLLVSPPAMLLRSDYRAAEYSSEQRWLRHPLAARVRVSHQLVTDGRIWTCMGPLMATEIARLRAAAGR